MSARTQYGIVFALVLGAAALYHWRSDAWELFPLDDAYIHFAYAGNLASGHGLNFQAPGETSVGSTSLLWVVLLALGQLAGVPAIFTARVLGVAAHAACAVLTAALLQPAAARWRAGWLPLAGGALVAVCGPMIWFALSGMETLLFVALGLAGLLAYRARRWVVFGLCVGLACLTRPEGAALGVAAALAEVWQHRRVPWHLWRAGAVAAALAVPWFAYLYLRTGDVLPGSYHGKQFTQQAAIEFFTSQAAWLSALAEIRPVVFVALSLGYWFLYFWGGGYLPGPGFDAPVPLERAGPAMLAAPVALLWLYLMGRGFGRLWRRRGEMEAGERSAWLAFALWVVLHNAAFAFLLPAPGTASRYIALDYVPMAVGVTLGLASFREAGKSGRRYVAAAAVVVAGVTLATASYWRSVYVSSIRQVEEVRFAIARRVAEATQPGDVIAAFDIGVLGYSSTRPLADLGGLTDNRVLEFAQAGHIGRYLCDTDAAYLVAPESDRSSGGSFYDYLGSLGLRADPAVELVEVGRSAMDAAEWRVGGLTTANSTAAVVLYRLNLVCD